MKPKQRSITDLSNDVLIHILIHVAKSSNGLVNLARTISVCRVFRELVHGKMVLEAIDYSNASLPRFHPAFWQFNGLVARCLCIGNRSALEIKRKYLEELFAKQRELREELLMNTLVCNHIVRPRDVEILSTGLRSKVLEAVSKKFEEINGRKDELEKFFKQMTEVSGFN